MTNELYHHGILGMHWGVRRYQSYLVRGRKGGKKGKELGDAKEQTKSVKEDKPSKPKSSGSGGGSKKQTQPEKKKKLPVEINVNVHKPAAPQPAKQPKQDQKNQNEQKKRTDVTSTNTKLSDDERSKIINSGDAKLVLKNADKLSNNEIEYALQNIDKKKRLSEIANPPEKSTVDKVIEMYGFIKSTADTVKTVGDAVKSVGEAGKSVNQALVGLESYKLKKKQTEADIEKLENESIHYNKREKRRLQDQLKKTAGIHYKTEEVNARAENDAAKIFRKTTREEANIDLDKAKRERKAAWETNSIEVDNAKNVREMNGMRNDALKDQLKRKIKEQKRSERRAARGK